MSELLTNNDPVPDVVDNNGFWPALSIAEYKSITRSDGTVEDARIAFDMHTALLKINEQLKDYQAAQEAAAITTAEDGDTLHRYRVAVYQTTKAFLLESYRDLDSREKGNDRADRMSERIDSCYRQATVAVNTILGKPDRFRVYEL